MLSRRRKLGGSPGPKGSPAPPPPPITPLAGDEDRPLDGPGRRLRGRRRAQREVAQASESCTPVSKSAEEMCLYKTPKRLLQSSFQSPVFSSPCNDTDGQQEIFWDPNSPTTCRLDERRNKKLDRRCSVAISDIVNRIAPKGEKPTTDSLLDMWIGEDAIPCTPGITKIKSRTRTGYIKFKTQSSEEELIKLAKQFDKNMVELDVRQEQDSETHDFVQTISKAQILNNHKEDVQALQSVSDEVPHRDFAVTLKGNSNISEKEQYKNNSQTHFDPNAEAALIALFDGSTQKCSGQFSQGLSNASFATNHNIHGKNNTLKEEIDNSTETAVAEKHMNKTSCPVTVTAASDSLVMAKSSVTSSIAKSEIKPRELDASIDFDDDDDDWEHMLTDDSFIMQISQASELLTTSNTSQPTVQNDILMLTASKTDKAKAGINGDLTISKSFSKNFQSLSSDTNNKNFPDHTKGLFPPKPNNEPMQLVPTESEVKYERNFSKTSFPTRIPDYPEPSVASNIQKTKKIIYPKFGSNMKVSAKEATLVARCTSLQLETGRDGKNPPNYYQSFNVSAKRNPNNSTRISNENNFCNLNQEDAPKQCSLFDDWSDPKLASEVIETCHELERSWDADDDDDDLLYQACDHVEKLTQQQDLKKDSQGPENKQKVNYNSYLGMETNSCTSEKGHQLLQCKHLNTDNISAHRTSLREVQTGKLTCKGSTNYGSSTNSTSTKNLSKDYKYPTYQNGNQHVSWNNSNVSAGVNKSSVLTGNLSLEISSGYTYTHIPSGNLHNQSLSHSRTTQIGCHVNKTSVPTSSDYSFTKIKNPQTLPQFSHSSIPSGSISDTRILQHSEKNKTQFVNSLLGETVPQQLLKGQFSESCKLPTKEEEEKNRKYSPEEIQRKRQEALIRRMSKARTSFVNAAHT